MTSLRPLKIAGTNASIVESNRSLSKGAKMSLAQGIELCVDQDVFGQRAMVIPSHLMPACEDGICGGGKVAAGFGSNCSKNSKFAWLWHDKKQPLPKKVNVILLHNGYRPSSLLKQGRVHWNNSCLRCITTSRAISELY